MQAFLIKTNLPPHAKAPAGTAVGVDIGVDAIRQPEHRRTVSARPDYDHELDHLADFSNACQRWSAPSAASVIASKNWLKQKNKVNNSTAESPASVGG